MAPSWPRKLTALFQWRTAVIQEALEATLPVIAALEAQGIPYFVSGSVAGSVHGMVRTTLDTDLVAALESYHVDGFLDTLGDRYYADPDSIRRATVTRRHFNLIHLESMFKVDVFVCGNRPYDRIQLERRQRKALAPAPNSDVFVASPEDLILAKLEWFQAGGETSDRQWQDILGVLRYQEDRLDEAYLERWGDVLGVERLLAKARLDASHRSQ
jgi:hypothetical protein